MKKILFKRYYMFFIFLLLFASRLLFSKNLDYNEKIINQRLSVVNGVGQIYSTPKDILVMADVISADEFLRQISKYETNKKLRQLKLYFPDVSYIDEYIENVSKKVENIEIYLLDIPNNDKYMRNRDYISYELKGVDKKVQKLNNVELIKVKVPEIDVSDIFLDSLTKQIFDSGYYKKYIEIKGEK